MREIIEIKKNGLEIEVKLSAATESEAAQVYHTPYITAGDVAKKTGLTRQQINNLAPRIPGAYQTETTKYWLFPYTAIAHIEIWSRLSPGRPKKK